MQGKRHGQIYTICLEFFALSYPFLFRLYRRAGRGTVVAPGTRVYHPKHLRLGRHVTVNSGTRFLTGGSGRIEIGDNCRLESNVVFSTYSGLIKLGNYTSVQANCMLHGRGGLSIGSNVMIAAGCVFTPFSHGFERIDVPMREQAVTMKGIVIEDDVWLGTGVRVLDGVRIGRGSIIGAGAVVNRDISPYSVAVGVPARVRRSRKEPREREETAAVLCGQVPERGIGGLAAASARTHRLMSLMVIVILVIVSVCVAAAEPEAAALVEPLVA